METQQQHLRNQLEGYLADIPGNVRMVAAHGCIYPDSRKRSFTVPPGLFLEFMTPPSCAIGIAIGVEMLKDADMIRSIVRNDHYCGGGYGRKGVYSYARTYMPGKTVPDMRLTFRTRHRTRGRPTGRLDDLELGLWKLPVPADYIDNDSLHWMAQEWDILKQKPHIVDALQSRSDRLRADSGFQPLRGIIDLSRFVAGFLRGKTGVYIFHSCRGLCGRAGDDILYRPDHGSRHLFESSVRSNMQAHSDLLALYGRTAHPDFDWTLRLSQQILDPQHENSEADRWLLGQRAEFEDSYVAGKRSDTWHRFVESGGCRFSKRLCQG